MAKKRRRRKKKRSNNKNNRNRQRPPKKEQKKKSSGRRSKERPTKISESFLRRVVPYGNMHFKDSYFRTGLFYGAVLTLMPHEGSVNGQPPMWGARLIPVTQDASVSARLILSFQTRDEKWVRDKATDAIDVSESSYSDASQASKGMEASEQLTRYRDQQRTVADINAGASYLDVTYKIVLYAPSRELLDATVRELTQMYQSRLGSVDLTMYYGQQQEDFTKLLAPAITHLGHHDGYSSIELAGIYPFVGRGWTDRQGDYIGQSAGDIHQSPILWDSESINQLAIIGSNNKAEMLGGTSFNVSAQAVWQTMIAQNELLNGRSTYELVLNDESIQDIGIDITNSTVITEMDKGSINPLQAFGEPEQELEIFPVLISKVAAMLHQLNTDLTKDEVEYFKEVLREFYISEQIWVMNPQENRDAIRLVGLADNTQYPTMKKLFVYLLREYRRRSQGSQANQTAALQLQRLSRQVDAMVSTYGHMFDVHTTIDVQALETQPRKIFTFGNLQAQGQDVLMAQFINVLTFIISRMNDGDSLHIYGAELLSQIAWGELLKQQHFLNIKDIRMVLGFTSTQAALQSPLFARADTTIMGQMTRQDIDAYGRLVSGTLPQMVVDQISSGDPKTYYLRRGRENTVFLWDAVV